MMPLLQVLLIRTSMSFGLATIAAMVYTSVGGRASGGRFLTSAAATTTTSSNSSSDGLMSNVMVTSGLLTILFASGLAYVLRESNKLNRQESKIKTGLEIEIQKESPTHGQSQVDVETTSQQNGGTNNVTATPEIVTTMKDYDQTKYPGGSFSVYFGTQTGTSEGFARVIEREGPKHGFFVRVIDLEDVKSNLSLLAERSVFLIATYGEGEPPDNATEVIHELQRRSQLDILFDKQPTSSPHSIDPDETVFCSKASSSTSTSTSTSTSSTKKILEYGVFGLGNKQYDNYNAMGKFLDASLEILGGTRVVALGLGNDDEDLESDFDNWKDKIFWPTMRELYLPADSNLNRNTTEKGNIALKVSDDVFALIPQECRYEVVYYKDLLNKQYINSSSTAADVQSLMNGKQIHNSSKHYFTSVDCPVTVVRELRSSKRQGSCVSKTTNDLNENGSTVHVEIDISNPIGGNLTYITADNLGVLPCNEPWVVDSVAQSLGWTNIEKTVFALKAAKNHEWHGAPFPMPITVRECLTRYCDLTGPLKRSDLKMLASYATDPLDQKALLRMSSNLGKAEYKEKIVDALVGMEQILKLCPSISMSLEHFVSICSPIQTRFYTISSSSSVYPSSVHLTVSVTSDVRPSNGMIVKGLCSNYLAKCDKTSSSHKMVRVFVRPSTFRLPTDSARPILMIGPGTGIAPMRALLQERQYQKQHQQLQVGKNILYFGCRKRDEDYIYQDELESYCASGVLDSYYVAFSRDNNSKDKVYVQHLLNQHSDAIWKLINDERCYIYVCGGVKMGHDVHETFQRIIEQNITTVMPAITAAKEEFAKDYLSQLSHDHRYIQELWA